MTAFPATRQEAMHLVERMGYDMASYDSLDVDCLVAESVDMDQLMALAKRGADTVGATEAWLYAPPNERGNDARQIMCGCLNPTKEMGEDDWEGEVDRPIVRRCLILPESQE